MKRKKIKGRCYIKGKQRGYLRRMRQKERERAQMKQYMRNIANFDGETYAAEMIKILRAELRERGKEQTAERREIIHTPEKNPAVWLPKKYPELFFAV